MILVLGFGYVGLEILKTYSNGYDEVYIVDSEAYPDRCRWATEHYYKFYKRDIFNIKDLLKDAKIVYNTISITQVPQRPEDSNPEIDNKIYKIGTEGNRYVLEHMRKDAKLAFLSSHCVFEGHNNIFNITEDFPTYPVLAYGKSKNQSEIDIKNANINYNILRLASVYGYNIAERVKIVANILAKLAALDNKINVTNPKCKKPFIGISDVARAIRYITDSFNKETFHLVNEHKSIEELALICKEYVSNLEINTDSSNRNFGYTLSNDKLLDTKFQFKQNIKDEIKDMIKGWRYQ